MAKYLDYEGLKYFIGKIKTSISGKADEKHTHSCIDISTPSTDYNAMPNLDEFLNLILEMVNDNESEIKNHTHSAATKTANGFMSARDKKIVDNLIFDTNQQAVFKIIDGKPVLETTEV